MDILQLSALGLSQGLTEFLPVSSSGHLLIAGDLFGRMPSLSESVYLHVGTLAATLLYFGSDIIRYFQAFSPKNLLAFKGGKLSGDIQSIQKEALLIVLANVPTGIMGIMAKKHLRFVLESPVFAAFGLLITGGMLYFSDIFSEKKKSVGIWDALLLGIAQGIGVLPGISRSGITIVAGLARGLNRQAAFRFSFLMSLPAVTGAALLEFFEDSSISVSLIGLISGVIIAFFVGLFALKSLEALVKKAKLKGFSYYLWIFTVFFFISRRLN